MDSAVCRGEMQPNNHVRVRIVCRKRGRELSLCVQVSRGVPAPLRCTPQGGGSGGGPDVCAECRRLLLERGRITEVVNDLIRRGWNDHLKDGAVVVAC